MFHEIFGEYGLLRLKRNLTGGFPPQHKRLLASSLTQNDENLEKTALDCSPCVMVR